eukprot:637511-Pelagomonas_calceolata.AAC.1
MFRITLSLQKLRGLRGSCLACTQLLQCNAIGAQPPSLVDKSRGSTGVEPAHVRWHASSVGQPTFQTHPHVSAALDVPAHKAAQLSEKLGFMCASVCA